MNKREITTNKQKNKIQSFGLFLNKHTGKIAVLVMCVCMMCSTVFATNTGINNATADSIWNTVIDTLFTWVLRLGIVTAVVGGVLVGIGWQSDDPTRKTNGFHTIIAGVIIAAVAGLALGLLKVV